MLESFRRPLLVALFLLALLGFHSLWVLAGGQYHVDLIFWPWKLGLSLAAAGLVLVLGVGNRKQFWISSLLLLGVLVVAGLVTYQAHLNEPTDEDGENTEQLS